MLQLPPEARLRTVIAAVADISKRPIGEIVPEHDLIADLGLDSLGFIRVVMTIERAIVALIPDADAAQAKTVADLVAILDGMQDPLSSV